MTQEERPHEYPDIKELFENLEPMNRIRLQQFFEQHDNDPGLCLDYAEYLWDAERTGVILRTVSDEGELKSYLLRDLDEAKAAVSQFLHPGEDLYIESKAGETLYSLFWFDADQLPAGSKLAENVGSLKGLWIPQEYTGPQ